MKKFREITDDLQRFDWWIGKLIFCLIEIGSGVGLWMEWISKTIATIAIISGIAVLIWPFISKYFNRTPKYIPFKDAIKAIGDCGYYDVNGHAIMHQNMVITRDSYYKGLLQESVNNKDIGLYGRKIHSSNSEPQKIEVDEFKELYLEEDCNSLSETLRDWSRQNKYTDLSFEKKELDLLLDKLKNEISS